MRRLRRLSVILLALGCVSAPESLPRWTDVSVAHGTTCLAQGTEWTCYGDDVLLPGPGTHLWVANGSQAPIGADQIGCVLDEDGLLSCVAAPAGFPLDLPTDPLAEFVGFANGVIGLDHDGRVSLWSDNPTDPTLLGSGYHSPRSHTDRMCLVDSQTVPICFGPGPGSGDLPDGGVLVADPFTNSVCSLLVTGEVECFVQGDSPEYTEVPEGPFVELGATDGPVCAIRAEDGSLACWGEHWDSDPGQDVPTAAEHYPDGPGWSDLTCSDEHCCAFQDEEVQCWGYVDERDYLDVPPRPPESGP